MNKSSPSDYHLARGGSKPLKLVLRAQSGEARPGYGGKGIENNSQRRHFLSPFHRCIDNSGIIPVCPY